MFSYRANLWFDFDFRWTIRFPGSLPVRECVGCACQSVGESVGRLICLVGRSVGQGTLGLWATWIVWWRHTRMRCMVESVRPAPSCNQITGCPLGCVLVRCSCSDMRCSPIWSWFRFWYCCSCCCNGCPFSWCCKTVARMSLLELQLLLRVYSNLNNCHWAYSKMYTYSSSGAVSFATHTTGAVPVVFLYSRRCFRTLIFILYIRPSWSRITFWGMLLINRISGESGRFCPASMRVEPFNLDSQPAVVWLESIDWCNSVKWKYSPQRDSLNESISINSTAQPNETSISHRGLYSLSASYTILIFLWIKTTNNISILWTRFNIIEPSSFSIKCSPFFGGLGISVFYEGGRA